MMPGNQMHAESAVPVNLDLALAHNWRRGGGQRRLPEAEHGDAHADPAQRLRMDLGGRVSMVLPTLEIRPTGLAVLNIDGPTAMNPAIWEEIYDGVLEIEKLATLADQARAHPDVKALLMRVHSPGGSVWGHTRLLESLEAFRRTGKPIATLVHDVAASNGYATAVMADKGLLYATPTSMVGSIGTAIVFVDESGMVEKQGGKVYAFASEDRKHVGPMTPEIAEGIKETVKDLGAQFVQHVAERRGLEPDAVRAFRGACVTAERALRAGLIDGITMPRRFIEEMDRFAMDLTAR